MLLAIVIILVVLAVIGGIALSPLLWALLLVALIIFIFGRRGASV